MTPLKTQRQRYGLLGQPVEHSLSPTMFNAAFKKSALNAEYLAFSVSREQLHGKLRAARRDGFAGFNITMPLKETVLPLLDAIEGDAEIAGSVNTVAVRESGLTGYNTDGEGFLRALDTYGFDPSHRTILIVGAGGAARGVIAALSKYNSRITVLNRTSKKARKFIEGLRGTATAHLSVLDGRNLQEQVDNSDLVVNATPLNTDELLEARGVPRSSIPHSTLVFDLAYADRTHGSSKSGLGPLRISPLELLLQQAMLSYKIWMGKPAPEEAMRQALVNCTGMDWRNTIS